MIITQTPLRISFAGGGTDIKEFYEQEDGMVISATIDKYVYIIACERYDEKIVLKYSRNETVDSVDEIKHDLIREAMKKAGVHKGIEIISYAEIPSEGSGLGSSSSFTVGLLNALFQFKGRQLAADWLTKMACEIEIDICKKPIGKQDQCAAAYGGINIYTFCKDGSIVVRNVIIPEYRRRMLELQFLMFYTNQTRRSEDILIHQKKETHKKMDILRKMRGQVFAMEEAILENNFDKIGHIMDEGWHLKRELYEGIITPEIDAMYKKAKDAGAFGGKICGAGGGGFLLLYVPLEKHKNVREALKGHYRELPVRFDYFGSCVIFRKDIQVRLMGEEELA
jgi:D-glycero-alpha-D-manno-heptose-7-phosphate kinase